jgi:DNA-binding YbaB/EbfC family protein
MSAQDLGALLQRAREVQERIASLQRELARRTVEGTSGAGLVRATVTGELRVLSVEIDPQLLAGGDRAMLQDLVAAAVNAAIANAQRLVQEEMQRAAGGLPLPFGPTQGPDPDTR